jgi:hypothetical protein
MWNEKYVWNNIALTYLGSYIHTHTHTLPDFDSVGSHDYLNRSEELHASYFTAPEIVTSTTVRLNTNDNLLCEIKK